MALGVIIAAFLNWVPYKLIKKCGILAYVISLVLIVMLKTPLGINSGGATRWLNLGFMQLQVADATKVCMIVFMGWYVNRFWKEFDKFRYTLILWLLVALQAGLILKISSNLSSCLILMLMVFILTFIVGKHPKMHLIIAAVGIVMIVIFIMWLKANMPLDSEMDKYPYQIRRFFGWLDPERSVFLRLYHRGSRSKTMQNDFTFLIMRNGIPDFHHAIVCIAFDIDIYGERIGRVFQ